MSEQERAARAYKAAIDDHGDASREAARAWRALLRCLRKAKKAKGGRRGGR